MALDYSKVMDADKEPSGSQVLEVVESDLINYELDIEKRKKDFIHYQFKINAMEVEVNALVVENEKSHETAINMVVQARDLEKSLDERRKKVIKDPDTFVRKFNAFIKPLRDKLQLMQSKGNGKINAYSYQIEMKRREDEKAAQDKIDRKQKLMDEAAKKQKIEAPILPKAKIPKKQPPVRTGRGSASTKMVWEYDIIDEGKVPRAYCQPAERLIRNAVDSGIREIEGVRIFETSKSTVRRF